LDEQFVNKYPNLKQIDYEDFLNIYIIIECYNNKLATKKYNEYVLNSLRKTHTDAFIPNIHISFIEKLSNEFNPDNMIIYDIGSCVLHWTQEASKIWKNSKVYLFDGMTELMLFYDEYNKQNNTKYEYNIGVICDEDYKRISFYQNNIHPGGNSYYREIGHHESTTLFTENHIKYKIGMKLETIIKNKNFPLPDLIKIDVQGAELDILKGSMSIINKAKILIVELQHTQYNKDAPLYNQTRDFLIENGWQVYAEKFTNNGPDADWCFINTNFNQSQMKAHWKGMHQETWTLQN
jgi:FkbM family methyltransferase